MPTLTITELLGTISAILNAVGFIIYFKLSKTSSSSALGWFLSAVVASSAAVVHYFITNDLSQSGTYFVGAFCCSTACLLNLKDGITPSNSDKLTATIALSIVIISYVHPIYATYYLAGYYLLLYSIFIKSILRGAKEPITPWCIWCATASIQIIALLSASATPQALLLPVINLICWGSVAYMSKRQLTLMACRPLD